MAGWFGWVGSGPAGFAALSLGPFGLGTRALTAHPPNWIQTNLTTRRRTKPAGLIESCTQGAGAPARVWGQSSQLRRSRPEVWGGALPRAGPLPPPNLWLCPCQCLLFCDYLINRKDSLIRIHEAATCISARFWDILSIDVSQYTRVFQGFRCVDGKDPCMCPATDHWSHVHHVCNVTDEK